jgi:UDP-glucose 4-epimerase
MKVLITGGAGFIGSHLVEHFQGKADIYVLDNLRSGYRKNLDALDCEFIEGSVTDRTLVRKAVKGVDYVFHLAAMVSVPESMTNPVECVEINTIGTLILLEESAKAGVKKLCFSSSAAVYGDNPTVPKTEDMLPEPKSPYAVTKLDGEYYCRIFHDAGRLNTVCMRYFNVFGPRQDPRSQYAAAVPIFIDRALKNEPLTVFGDGEQTRDFVYVRDIVAANVFLAEHADLSGVYNVASGKRMTVNELARKIIALTGSQSQIQYAAPRPGDVKHSQAVVEKLNASGLTLNNSFQPGVQKTIAFFTEPKT